MSTYTSPGLAARLCALTAFAFAFAASVCPAAAQSAWTPLSTGTTAELRAVHFVDADTGYVVGAAGTALRTVDGGETWTDVSLSPSRELYGVHFFDGRRGIVVGARGGIGRTLDGGTTWTPVSSGTSVTLYDVAFADAVGLAGGASQTILRSEDHGATWTVVQDGFFGGGFFGVDQVDDDTGFVAGENSIFQPLFGATTDGGVAFDFTAFYLNSNEGRLLDVDFIDAQRGVTAGRTFDFQGALARSEDGGATWTTTLFPDGPIESVAFATDLVGYAVGAAGTILETTDGGVTWSPDPSGTTAALYGLDTPTPTVGYAVGSGGTVLKRMIPTGTSAEETTATGLTLVSNYPNPFTTQTVLRFTLPEPAHVTLRVYDALGREVVSPVDGLRLAGAHEVHVDASGLAPGVYVYTLAAGAHVATRTMVRR